jgi:H+/Cl- antiporter ClcA
VGNVLGLLLFVVYVLLIVGTAAGVTWLVVRYTPSRKPGGTAKS